MPTADLPTGPVKGPVNTGRRIEGGSTNNKIIRKETPPTEPPMSVGGIGGSDVQTSVISVEDGDRGYGDEYGGSRNEEEQEDQEDQQDQQDPQEPQDQNNVPVTDVQKEAQFQSDRKSRILETSQQAQQMAQGVMPEDVPTIPDPREIPLDKTDNNSRTSCSVTNGSY